MSGRKGCLYGVGVGPGDVELMTLKAVRILREVPMIAYFAKRGRQGHARTIAASVLPGGQREIPLDYPVTTELPVDDARYSSQIEEFFENSAAQLAEYLAMGKDVAVLCEGDPFLYGSFMHLHCRLAPHFSCRVVPGITGMSGCWTNVGIPMAWGDNVLTVLPGTLSLGDLVARLKTTDAAVIMKLGSSLPKVRQAITEVGLASRAVYVEYGTMAAEKILPVDQLTDDKAPYFSLILVPGKRR